MLSRGSRGIRLSPLSSLDSLKTGQRGGRHEEREKLRALKLEALRADIQQGINSGPSRPLQQVNVELQAYPARAELGVGLRCCVHQR